MRLGVGHATGSIWLEDVGARSSTELAAPCAARGDGDGQRREPARDNHRPKPNTPAAKEVKPHHTPPYGEIALTRGPMGQLQDR